MLKLDRLLFRDDTPERLEYCQPLAPNMTVGDIWHCTTSHRTYMCVEGVQDPMFNNVVEIDVGVVCGDRFDCTTPNLVPGGVVGYPEMCNGLCMTGHDIGVPSNEIAYAHPECPAHGSCNGQCSPSIQVYHVDCPVHGRKPSQTRQHSVGPVPPMSAKEGDTWYQPQTKSHYVRQGINWVSKA